MIVMLSILEGSRTEMKGSIILYNYITLSNTLTLAPALTNTWQIAMLSILEGSSSQA